MMKYIIKKLALWFRSWAIRKNHVTCTRVLKVAKVIMKSQKYCIVNTIAEETVHSRVLQPFPPEESFIIWFGTGAFSRKIKEIQQNPHGSISYLDAKKGAGVSLVGRFEIVNDLASRHKYFMDMWWAFFVNGPEGKDFVSLKFIPEAIEVWDASRGITPPPFGLKSANVFKKDGIWILNTADSNMDI